MCSRWDIAVMEVRAGLAFWSKRRASVIVKKVKALNWKSLLFETAHDFVNDAVYREDRSIDHFRIRRDDEW